MQKCLSVYSGRITRTSLTENEIKTYPRILQLHMTKFKASSTLAEWTTFKTSSTAVYHAGNEHKKLPNPSSTMFSHSSLLILKSKVLVM